MPAPLGNTYAQGHGRPSDYDESFDALAYNYCLLGATDEDLAVRFGVTEQTINNWKEVHLSFFESIKRGKDIADAEVAQSLFHRAKGYSHPDTHFSSFEGTITATPTTKHYPPDTTAAIFWLKNRQRKHWRDKVDVEQTTEVTVNVKRQRKERPEHDA